jgi:hypothetical protein
LRGKLGVVVPGVISPKNTFTGRYETTRRKVPFRRGVFARRESPTRRRKPDEKTPTRSFTPTSNKYSGSACVRRDFVTKQQSTVTNANNNSV